jgi:solute carrier family 25 citrate transporter 1
MTRRPRAHPAPPRPAPRRALCSGYELGKRITPRTWGTASDLMTATIAQTVAGCVFCPIDIVKQRVQTAGVMAAPAAGAAAGPAAAAAAAARITPLEAARAVWAHQGLRGFYRGYWAMNALWMPWNLIYLPLYEASKRRVYHWQRRRQAEGQARGGGVRHQPAGVEEGGAGGVVVLHTDLPLSQVLPAWAFPLCSSTSAAVAAVVTHPVDVVKTRLQVLSAAEAGRERRTAVGVARELHLAEGAAGFGRGMAARVATLSVGSTVSWFVYEMVKRRLAADAEEERRREGGG